MENQLTHLQRLKITSLPDIGFRLEPTVPLGQNHLLRAAMANLSPNGIN